MSAEEWRPIPDAPGYDVSTLGRVRSRVRFRGSTEPRILRAAPNIKTGYAQVELKGARRGKVTVHSLVLLAFIGPRPDGMQVRHIDGDQSNNSLSNLAYGTVSENQYDQVRHGTHAMASRTHCKSGHAFTPENTRVRQNQGKTFRECIECKRARAVRTWRKREAKRRLAAGMSVDALADAYPLLADAIETRELRAA